MKYETILVDNEDGIVTVTFNRPAQKNAMNPQMHLEMHALLSGLRYDPSVRVLVLTGAGDSFSAGVDLKARFLGSDGRPRERERMIHELGLAWRIDLLRHFPAPTIAAVNGYCFGGANLTVECCDLAVAAENARFGISEINFNHPPGGGLPKALGLLLRPRDALLYAMTGRPFDGKQAAAMGYVNFAVPADELPSAVQALAAELRGKDAQALRATKEMYRHGMEMPWSAFTVFSHAMETEVKALQGDGTVTTALQRFAEGETRPGLGGPTEGDNKERSDA